MKRFLALLVGATLAAASAVAQPAGNHAHHAVQAGDIEFGPGSSALPPGMRGALLSGNPAEPGPYVIRALLPANYRIPPHWHPTDEHLTVVSGTLHVGSGDTFSTDGGTALTAGGYAHMPAEMRHFVWTEGETVIQVHGIGPFVVTYVNPADDPRGQAE